MSMKMKEAGFERTAIQCREKVKETLKSQYKQIRDHTTDQVTTGKLASLWTHLIDAILGDHHVPCPCTVVQSTRADNTAVDIEDEIDRHVEDSTDESLYSCSHCPASVHACTNCHPDI